MEQLLCCVQALVEVCQEDCKEISLQLMKVLVTIMAVPNSQHLTEKVNYELVYYFVVFLFFTIDKTLCLDRAIIICLAVTFKPQKSLTKSSSTKTGRV